MSPGRLVVHIHVRFALTSDTVVIAATHGFNRFEGMRTL
jgi:hypothetical protein